MQVDELFDAHERPNIVLVTVDCCRFDTAALARTPVLDGLGPLRRAVTPGTFTLPAHMAFFSGYLPNVVELPHVDWYSRERRQMWRLSRAKRKARDSYLMELHGDTVWEGLSRLGYRTVGAGGVRWFLTKTLTGYFDDFVFRGPDDYADYFRERVLDDFVLAAPESIARLLPGDAPWALFVNALETHAPYDDGEQPPEPGLREVIERAAPIWAGRLARSVEVHVAPEEFQLLHRQQCRALESVDARLGRLFDELPRPFLAVVCGDHGECFGEGARWGHGFPAEPVWNVPMWVGVVDG